MTAPYASMLCHTADIAHLYKCVFPTDKMGFARTDRFPGLIMDNKKVTDIVTDSY